MGVCLSAYLLEYIASILHNSGIVTVRSRLQAIPLAMITMRKSIHEFPFFPCGYVAPVGGTFELPELCYNIID